MFSANGRWGSKQYPITIGKHVTNQESQPPSQRYRNQMHMPLPPLTFHVPTDTRKSFLVVKSLYLRQMSLMIEGEAVG